MTRWNREQSGSGPGGHLARAWRGARGGRAGVTQGGHRRWHGSPQAPAAADAADRGRVVLPGPLRARRREYRLRHAGTSPSPYRPADRELAVRGFGAAPRQPRQPAADPAWRAERDDRRARRRALRGVRRRTARRAARLAAVDRATRAGPLHGAAVRAPRGPAGDPG